MFCGTCVLMRHSIRSPRNCSRFRPLNCEPLVEKTSFNDVCFRMKIERDRERGEWFYNITKLLMIWNTSSRNSNYINDFGKDGSDYWKLGRTIFLRYKDKFQADILMKTLYHCLSEVSIWRVKFEFRAWLVLSRDTLEN